MATKSAISFGLVHIPISLHTATQDNDVSFNQLHKEDHSRIRYKKTCGHCGKEVKTEDIIKGFQYDKDQYVVVTEDDFEKIKTEKQRSMQILHFTTLDSISPVYYDKTYHAVPEAGGDKAFELLRTAMMQEQVVAVAKTVLGTKETLLTLIPREDGLLIQTMFYADEVKALPQGYGRSPVVDAELAMAKQLITGMIKPFAPEEYKDEYQERLRELIATKIAGKEVVSAASDEQAGGGNVIDLMEALKASIEQNKPETKSTRTKKQKGAWPMDLFEIKNVAPMLIAEEKPAFDSPDWIYELKLDGIRCVAYLDKAGTVLRNKRNKDVTAIYPELGNVHRQVKKRCILDGEVFVLKDGRPNFSEVQRRSIMTNQFKIELAVGKLPVSFVAFDLLYIDREQTIDSPLMERKKLLQKTVSESERIAVSRYIEQNGIALYDAAEKQGLEGIVAKRKDSKYYFGKQTKSWVKCKALLDEDFVACGYYHKSGNIVSVILGSFDVGRLVYRGHVVMGVSREDYRIMTTVDATSKQKYCATFPDFE